MAHPSRIILRNTLWLTAAEVATGGLMFFVTIWLANYLGAAGFGQLNFSLSVVAFFNLLADFGLHSLAIRDLAKDKSQTQRYVNNIISLRVLLALVTFGLLVLVAWWLPKPLLIQQLVLLLGIWMLANVNANLFQAVFRAHEKMHYEAIAKVVANIFFFGLIAWFVRQQGSLLAIGGSYVASAMLLLALNAAACYRFFTHFRFGFDRKLWRQLLAAAWPFAVSAAFVTIYYSMDSVMLGWMGRDEAVGWYNAAYKPIMFLTVLNALLTGSIFPTLARIFSKSMTAAASFLERYLRLISLLAIPLAVGGILVADQIINLLFTADYQPAVRAFQILMATVSLILFNVILGNIVLIADQQRRYMWGVGLGALVNIIGNFSLIPRYSLYGAATATLLAELAVFCWMYHQAYRILPLRLFGYWVRPLIASFGMGVALWFAPQLPWYATISGGAALYAVVLVCIGGVSRDDIAFFKAVILNRSSHAST